MKTPIYFTLFAAAVFMPALYAQQKPVLIPELLWSGSWESRHNLANRLDFNLTAPDVHLAFRLQLLDRRPASGFRDFAESFGGETAGKTITQPGLGLYHLTTGSRLLYGTLDSYGLPARIRNVWIRGAPYAESRAHSEADLKTAPASTAATQGYVFLGSPDLPLGQGTFHGFGSITVNDVPALGNPAENDPSDKAPALNLGLEYSLGKGNFRLEGFYTGQTLPERKSSTWFNEKPALPKRDTRLFAGAAAFSVPAFALAADLAWSETFAFGRDYYGNVGMRFGDKPWRFSLAMDAAGSRYVDNAGNNPGAGTRAAARLERRGKKSGLFRLAALVRGPGPAQGTVQALTTGDFAAFAEGINRMSGELYYRPPESSVSFGLGRFPFSQFTFSRFSVSIEQDARNEKKVLNSAGATAAFKLGPVNSVSEGKITGINHKASAGMKGSGYEFDSYRLTQSFSCTINTSTFNNSIIINTSASRKDSAEKEPGNSVPKLGGAKPSVKGKKTPLSVQFSARAGYEKTAGKDGGWDTSFSASVRSKKNRLTVKAAAPAFSRKWEYTISWRMQL
ncbi:MAG: hypothetical protein LBB72_08675 [Spirochaetaceae bacterium]|jgi:ribosomal protein S11|nr:hypothetical protein [Spirochaetaceae bacterium]